MKARKDLRKFPRQVFDVPEVGAVYGFREIPSHDSSLEVPAFGVFVDVLNISEGGAAAEIESSIQLEPDSLANFIFVDSSKSEWEATQVRVMWIQPSLSKNLYLTGFEFIYKLSKDAGIL